ncbi:ubiquitin-like protein ATG12 isoform X2 [Macrobrachium rosenbergii]|uniref:ubiquitin-like protein ATG12 isoform X2 n=1 Tax=Macrobrachium rosenbergii TaxID=79674 RepID=UPI0034D72CB2
MEEGKGGGSSADTTMETQEQSDQQDVKETVNKKIDVLLKATGDAPIMKKKKWAVEGDKPVGWVAEFIRKYLKLEPSESLGSGV